MITITKAETPEDLNGVLELIRAFSRWAMGHRRCLLWSHHSMHTAHAVYAHAGFRKVPFSSDFQGATGGIDICMEMTLEEKTATCPIPCASHVLSWTACRPAPPHKSFWSLTSQQRFGSLQLDH